MKKKKIISTTILIVISIALLAGIIYSLLPKKMPLNDPYHSGNSAGNLHNGGLFCEIDGKVYFSNSNDRGRLYVMNSDETEVKKLNELNVFSLNVGGDYIYFCQGSSRFSSGNIGVFRANPGLYRSKSNGKDVTSLKSNVVLTATLYGNEIFYQNYGNEASRAIRLYKIGIDGEDDRQLSDEVINPSSFANGSLYYSRTEDDHFVYQLDAVNGYSSIVFESNTYNAIYEDGYIYFMDLDHNYRLCRYSVYSDVIEVLTSDQVDFYNVGNGVIFYQKNSRTEPALIRMGLDGYNPEIIREGNHNNINMTSQFVYFQEYGNEMITYKASLYGVPSVSYFVP